MVKLALLIPAVEIAFDRDERIVVELLLRRYTSDSENFGRKDLPLGLTRAFL